MRGALNTDIDPVWLAFAMIAALWVEPAAVRHLIFTDDLVVVEELLGRGPLDRSQIISGVTVSKLLCEMNCIPLCSFSFLEDSGLICYLDAEFGS